MGKVIAVSSGKGGTGKTTTVAALSSCLAALGYKTLCIDFDAGMRNLDLSLCMADYAIADFADVLSGRLELMDACHEHPRIQNLFFLAAPIAFDPETLDFEDARAMFDRVRDGFDFCFVDCPSGIGPDFKLAHAGTDVSVIVTIGELPAIRDAQITAEVIRNPGVSEIRLLINRVLPEHYVRLQATIDDVIDLVGVQLIGVVREDKSVFLALHENTPLILYKKRLAAYDFLDAARRLAGEDIPLRLRR